MLDCQKAAFSLPESQHYLNCAYMAPLSRAAEEAGIAGIRRKRDPARVTPADFFPDPDLSRQLFGRMIGAEPARIAMVPAVSYAMATFARNLELSAGRSVVIASEQFPSNVHVWRSACRAAGAELRTVSPPAGPGRGAGWNERILEAIDGSTAAVAISNVHWTDGTRFDLAAIGERARAVGAALIVDGTQSIGALPLDVAKVKPDGVVAAGYKWLMGPYSTALAYFGPRFDGGRPLEETWLGRAGSEDFRNLVSYRDDYQPGAVRFDVGQRSNFVLLPMLNTAMQQILDWGVESIQEYCRGLTEGFLERAREAGYAVEDEHWRGAHLFGLRPPAGTDIAQLQERLGHQNVVISVRGDSLRISPNVYNDADDIAALEAALIG